MRIRKAFGKRAPVADALCDAGRYGQKTGRGYYLYEGRNATPDPEVDAHHRRRKRPSSASPGAPSAPTRSSSGWSIP